ncbi:hypothetical protein [Chromobacterium haemolyticum]|uniref:hypothetical protein n=1 Tax=Chromobacterium haemolyticum TaxID=394935 RepID=UPI0015C454C8|nr:hypothetical protein [Chromobacterium haemolyticum]
MDRGGGLVRRFFALQVLGYQFLLATIYPCVDFGAVVVQDLADAAAFLFEQLEPVQVG